MKDRQPTKVLSNGAIRYGIYNSDGSLDHYEYMKRMDEPTVLKLLGCKMKHTKKGQAYLLVRI